MPISKIGIVSSNLTLHVGGTMSDKELIYFIIILYIINFIVYPIYDYIKHEKGKS